MLNLISADLSKTPIILSPTKTEKAVTTYEAKGLTLELYQTDKQLTNNSLTWIEDSGKVFPVLTDANSYDKGVMKPLTNISFKVNMLESRNCSKSFFVEECNVKYWDFSEFEKKNVITNKTIKAIYSNDKNTWYLDLWEDVLKFFGKDVTPKLDGYMITYYGEIKDLDPSLIEVITSTTTGIYNRTEATTFGVRNNAPVLFMDFNSPAEQPLGTYNLSRGTYIKDGSLYNNFGTITGNNESSMWVQGNFSNALQFDGVNDYITANGTSNQIISNGSNFTLSAWVYSKGGSGNTVSVVGLTSGNTGEKDAYSIRILSGGQTTKITMGNSTLTQTTDCGSLNFNTWYHIVGTYNGTSISCYMNGVLQSALTKNLSGISPSRGTLSQDIIGAGYAGTAGFMNGSIDEVMIFNRSLSSTEVNNLYINQSNNINDALVNDVNLVSYWRLNETQGTLAKDDKGRNNGTLINFDMTSPKYNSTGGYDGSGAYSFDGVNDVMTLSITPTTIYTISGWIKNSTATSWSHIVWSSNGTNYTNGLVSNPNQKPFNWTRIGMTGATYFNGTIDQVQIFNRALDPSEVLALYNGTLNNSNYIGKYNLAGDFKSGVFYNSSQQFWNTTLSIADTYSTRSGIVNRDNSINLTYSNLVSYWKLDGNTLDAKGINNGTAVNGVNNATGISSGAMRFDGVDDYVDAGNSSSLQLNSTLTIAGWTKGVGDIVAKQAYSNTRWNYFLASGAVYVTDTSGITWKLDPFPYPSDNNWHFVLATYNNSDLLAYVDGVLVADNQSIGSKTLATTGGSITPNLQIGRYYYTPSWAYGNASMDEVLVYNTSLSASQVNQLYKSGLSQHATTNVTLQTRTANTYNITDPSLVSFWSFNNDNTTLVIDELGRNNGTYTNGALSNSSSGLVGNGGYFDGSNDYVNVGNNVSLNPTSITFSYWVKGTSFGGGEIIRKFGPDYSIYGGYWSRINSNTPFFAVASSIGGGYEIVTSTFNLADGRWHNVAGTYNNPNKNLSIYVDGVLNSQIICTGTISLNSNNPLNIGAFPSSSEYTSGLVDEVRIYNRSLSASEVLALYNLGSTHISDWSAWSSENVITDNNNANITTSSKFMQFKTNLYSNDTGVSPYIINYNISQIIAITPSIDFVNPTMTTGNYNQVNSIYANVTSILTGYAHNLSIFLYNSSGIYSIISTSNNNSYYNWTNLPIGIYYLNATSCITSCNSTETRIINLNDTTPPTISIISPINNLLTNNHSILFNFSIYDWSSYSTIFNFNGTNYTYTNPIIIEIADGNYNLSVIVTDIASNTNSISRMFYIDDINPILNMITPLAEYLYTLGNINLNMSANKNMSSWWYSLNGLSNISFNQNTTINIQQVAYNNLIVWANDTYNNLGTISRWFYTAIGTPNQTINTTIPNCPSGLYGTYQNGSFVCLNNPVSPTCPEEVFGYYNPSLPSIKLKGCIQ